MDILRKQWESHCFLNHGACGQKGKTMNEIHSGDSNLITRNALDAYLIETRYLNAGKPDVSLTVFGKTFESPIMTGALSHLDRHLYPGAMRDLAKGAAMAGTVAWIGMENDKTIEQCVETGAAVIEVIKPYRDRDFLRAKMKHAAECGVMAIAIDIDHPFAKDGGPDFVDGQEMAPVTTDELAEYCRESPLPLMVKGVLSVRDASLAVEAGAAGMVVSHHNGRIPFAWPAIEVLPEISGLTAGKVLLFADGDVRSGVDAFKLMANGAKAVSAGRILIPELEKNGPEGVRDALVRMRKELSGIMACTGCRCLEDMEPSLLHRRNF